MVLRQPASSLSVVIPTSNDDDRLALSLEGYARQTYHHFDIHIVNDGGSGATAGLVDRYRDRLNIYYYYLDMPGRYHPASARNLGIANCAPGRIILSDCDSVPCPVVMEEHSRYGKEKVYVLGIRRRIPRIIVEGMLIPRHRLGLLDSSLLHQYPWIGDQRLNEDRFWGVFQHLIDDTRPTNLQLAGLARYFGVRVEDMPGDIWKAWLCWTFNVSYLGDHLFDPGFDCAYGFEDLEMALRLIEDGYEIKLNPNIVAYHLDHDIRAEENIKQSNIFRATLARILQSR